MAKKQCKDKAQYWTFIVYPGDKFDLEGLKGEHIPFAQSPLHQPDSKKVDEDGNDVTEAPKEHYHILVKFPYAMGGNCAQFLSNEYGTGVKAFPVSSPQGLYDYLTHKWDKDKEQFDGSVTPALYNGFRAMSNKSGEYGTDAIEILCNIALECKDFKQFTYTVMYHYPEFIGLVSAKAFFFKNIIM